MGRPRAELPSPEGVASFGAGKRGQIRRLYSEGCSVDEIAIYLRVRPDYVSQAIRYQRRHRVICEHMKNRRSYVKPAEVVTIDPSAMPVAYEGPMRCSL